MVDNLFTVGRTTLFTPVDINLEQVVDFHNFYACTRQFLYSNDPNEVPRCPGQNVPRGSL
jgi:hypothetical protein